jgi:hypothetical protein
MYIFRLIYEIRQLDEKSFTSILKVLKRKMTRKNAVLGDLNNGSPVPPQLLVHLTHTAGKAQVSLHDRHVVQSGAFRLKTIYP